MNIWLMNSNESVSGHKWLLVVPWLAYMGFVGWFIYREWWKS